MSKVLRYLLKVTPVALAGVSLLASNSVLAQNISGKESVNDTLEQINNYNSQTKEGELNQVTNVNQLRDVSPTDWAYEALRSLVDRYGCIVGYPNQTYRGNQALSRYEFAAGLNACLNQIERLIASSEAVAREDIETLQRLMEEFEAELATLGGRVDNLEGRVAFLEDHQFSTTTKLNGEVIFAVVDTFSDNDDTQTTLSDRVRLNFDTSFTGKDRLRTRLQAGNVPRLDTATGFDSTRLGFDANNDNNIEIDDLYYRFPIGEQVTAYVGTSGLDLDNIFDVNNPILEGSGDGALSRFARRNPLVFRGTEGVGAGATFELNEQIAITALYLTDDGEDGGANPSEGQGLFNGSYSAGAQVKFSPFEKLDLTATYVRSFQTAGEVDLTGGTGSDNGEDPFAGAPASADRLGFGANYLIGEKFNVGVWGGVAFADEVGGEGEANLFTVAGSFSLLDLGKEGAVLSVTGGVPPKIFDSENALDDSDTSFLIEGQYQYPINDNILITPGAYVVINPDHNEDNDTEVVGVIRTTFKF
jgi:hypothetical protein